MQYTADPIEKESYYQQTLYLAQTSLPFVSVCYLAPQYAILLSRSEVSVISGQKIKRMGVQKYVGRIKEFLRIVRQHSSFYIGLYGHNWINFTESSYDLVTELLRLSRNKRKYYQQGERAMKRMALS